MGAIGEANLSVLADGMASTHSLLKGKFLWFLYRFAAMLATVNSKGDFSFWRG
jgi:hypothetical protein